MKKVFAILTSLLLTLTLWAQIPDRMSYQAVIRDADNAVVVNQQVGMRISIVSGEVDGFVAYAETQTPTINNNGLVSIQIGTGLILLDDFSSIDWTSSIFFIKTEIDITGGTNYTITGISQLLSVPYAFHSKSSEEFSGSIGESQIYNLKNYLTEESDPQFSSWDKSTGIDITEDQIADLKTYLIEEVDPQFASWDKNAGIAITESQITDLKTYLTSETDPTFTSWDKSTGIDITESQISDLKAYLTEEADPKFTAWDKDFEDLTNTPTTITPEQSDAIDANTAKNSYPTEDATKLEGIEKDATVGADWDENVTNKPDLSVYAMKAYMESLEAKLEQVTWVLEDPEIRGVIKDIDGNQYRTVVINNTVWMAENLRTTKLNDGTEIKLDPVQSHWGKYAFSNYCWYNNNKEFATKKGYGIIYNVSLPNTGKLCPSGWSVPTVSQWKALINYVKNENGGSTADAITALKSTEGWVNGNGTDKYGFSLKPSGMRTGGGFKYAGISFRSWLSRKYPDDFAVSIYESNKTPYIGEAWNFGDGESVRCVKR